MKNSKITLFQVIILIIAGGIFITCLYTQVEEDRKPGIYTGSLQGTSLGNQSPFRIGPDGRRGILPTSTNR